MLHGRPYDQASPTATTCPCCGAEWLCVQEHQAICTEPGCEKPISLCCINGGHAQRCEDCKEWHCTEHLSKTNCGMLCDKCLVDLARSGQVEYLITEQVIDAQEYWRRVDEEQCKAIAGYYEGVLTGERA
jgi:hypothetical protein